MGCASNTGISGASQSHLQGCATPRGPSREQHPASGATVKHSSQDYHFLQIFFEKKYTSVIYTCHSRYYKRRQWINSAPRFWGPKLQVPFYFVFKELFYSLARESCLTDLWSCPRLSREFIWYNTALHRDCYCGSVCISLGISSCADEYMIIGASGRRGKSRDQI